MSDYAAASPPSRAVSARIREAVKSVRQLQTPGAVAGELAKHLGYKLTAAVGNVTDTRRVTAWIAGEGCQREQALRAALQATLAVVVSYGDQGARSWFMSTNPDLEMSSPLAFVRRATDPDEYDRLVAVAVQDAS